MDGKKRVLIPVCSNGQRRTEHRRGGEIPWLMALLMVVTLHLSPGIAAPGAKIVGVVDFYALTPLGSFEGVIPERFAADDLANLLTRATSGGVTVIPREAMQQAETAMRWREEDVLRFARLSALAHALGADWLVVGWIPMLAVGREGFGTGGCCRGEASVVVQVFDASQERIVAETRQWALRRGIVRSLLAEQVLHTALEPTIPSLIRMLAAQTP